MQTIDPNALRQLRSRSHLTLEALAKAARVSPRTLSRIEQAESTRAVRENTLRRLASFFKVSADVLAGDAPVPDPLAVVGPPRTVSPKHLREARARKGWSRAELAGRSGVSDRQISRLETSWTTARQDTLAALAAALETDPWTLVIRDAEAGPDPDPIQLGIKVSPQLRLAYDLVARRYGPTRKQIIELAPLLFVLAAEGCLAWRRRLLQEVDEAIDHLKEFGDEHDHLHFVRSHADLDRCDGYWREQDSIEENDLLGNVDVKPFADYLREQAENLRIEKVVDLGPMESEAAVGFGTIWGAEPYLVCEEDLAELAGGSKRALWALAYGDVPVGRIPRDLLAPEAEQARVEWLEDHLTEAGREQGERANDLLEALRNIGIDL